MRDVIAMLDGYQVEPGNGANYAGGAAYPDEGGFPTLVSGSYGLAGYLSEFARGGFTTTPEPGNGANYVGGSAYPDQGGFPTLVSGSYGLAGLRAKAGVRAAVASGASRKRAVAAGRVARSLSGVRTNAPQAHAYAAAFAAARYCGKSAQAAREIARSVASSIT